MEVSTYLVPLSLASSPKNHRIKLAALLSSNFCLVIVVIVVPCLFVSVRIHLCSFFICAELLKFCLVFRTVNQSTCGRWAVLSPSYSSAGRSIPDLLSMTRSATYPRHKDFHRNLCLMRRRRQSGSSFARYAKLTIHSGDLR